MKHAANFRLSQDALHALYLLEEQTHMSKTAIVEDALLTYAKKKLSYQNSLLKFAGILSEEEADSILKDIQSSRKNKKMDMDL